MFHLFRFKLMSLRITNILTTRFSSSCVFMLSSGNMVVNSAFSVELKTLHHPIVSLSVTCNKADISLAAVVVLEWDARLTFPAIIVQDISEHIQRQLN